MEYLVMECGLSYAVVMDQDGRILKVPNLGYTVGQSLKDVVLLPERPAKTTLHKRLARWGTMVACLCLLLLGSWTWQSPIGTVRMQINPDVQMSVNRFDRVVALEGLNEDGTSLIDGYRAYGKGMKTVSDELADRAEQLLFIVRDHNAQKILFVHAAAPFSFPARFLLSYHSFPGFSRFFSGKPA